MGSQSNRRRRDERRANQAATHGGPKMPNKPATKKDPVNVLKCTADGGILVEKLHVNVRERNLIFNSTLELKLGRHYGLVGPNGSGKSSLLSQIHDGTIPVMEHWSKHYVFEEMKESDVNVLDAVMCCDIKEKRKLEKLLATSNLDKEEYAKLHQEFDEKFGDKPQHCAGGILKLLGFNANMQERNVKEFSPGFRMRIALARALYVEPDLLLLDLPTKNLDLETVDWLTTHLSSFQGTLVVISNSESFLAAVCTDIIEIDIGKNELVQYNGHDVYLTQKNQGKLIEGEQGVTSTTKMPGDEFGFGVISRTATNPEPSVIECRQVDCADQYSRVLFKGVNFSMTATSKIALVGSNGSGKSVFLDILAKEANFTRMRGRIQHFTQKSTRELDLTTTGEKYMQTQALKVSDLTSWRAAAGSFGLTDEALKGRIEYLSDGQRTRLILAGMAVQKPAILLLDEPAADLDINAVASLAEALNNWNGAFVIVCNNINLIKLACKEVWACVDKSVKWIVGRTDENGDENEEWIKTNENEKWIKTNGEKTDKNTIEIYKDEMIQRADDARSMIRLKTTSSERPIFLIDNREKVAWPFIRYETYVDSSGEHSKDSSIPLSTFKARVMVAHAPCQSVKEGYLEIPGEISPGARYPVATEYAKKFCRTMLAPSWILRTHQKCLSKFTKENIYVTPDGAVKFRGVTVVEFSEEHFAAYIDAAYEIIKDMFSENGEVPPVDIQLLLDLMKSKKEKFEIFHIHASLVPLANYGEFFVRMIDWMKYKMPEKERERILLKLPLEYLDNWTVDEMGQIAENWTKAMQTNMVLRTHIVKNPKFLRPPPAVLTADEIEKHKLRVAKDFTDCLRHRKAHIMENYKGVCRYHADGSNLATLVRYPKVTCILQEELHDAEELRALMLHQLMH